MCIMTGKLGVAFHEHASATYSVVVYNLTNKGNISKWFVMAIKAYGPASIVNYKTFGVAFSFF